jgi:hypothetical protein
VRSDWKCENRLSCFGSSGHYGRHANKLDGFLGWEQPYEAMSAKPLIASDFASDSSRVVVVGLLSVLGLIGLGAAAD